MSLNVVDNNIYSKEDLEDIAVRAKVVASITCDSYKQTVSVARDRAQIYEGLLFGTTFVVGLVATASALSIPLLGSSFTINELTGEQVLGWSNAAVAIASLIVGGAAGGFAIFNTQTSGAVARGQYAQITKLSKSKKLRPRDRVEQCSDSGLAVGNIVEDDINKLTRYTNYIERGEIPPAESDETENREGVKPKQRPKSSALFNDAVSNAFGSAMNAVPGLVNVSSMGALTE